MFAVPFSEVGDVSQRIALVTEKWRELQKPRGRCWCRASSVSLAADKRWHPLLAKLLPRKEEGTERTSLVSPWLNGFGKSVLWNWCYWDKQYHWFPVPRWKPRGHCGAVPKSWPSTLTFPYLKLVTSPGMDFLRPWLSLTCPHIFIKHVHIRYKKRDHILSSKIFDLYWLLQKFNMLLHPASFVYHLRHVGFCWT